MPEIYNSTELRREMHPMAELGFDVARTADFVLSKLRALGIEASRIGDTNGVLAVIRGREPGPVLLLRSDMDALPFTEKGRTVAVHACGHDAHMAMMLETASRLAGKIRRGTLKILFQPAEELLDKFGRAVRGAAESVGARAEVDIGSVGPAAEYDPGIHAELEECIRSELGSEALAPDCGGGSEDFFFFKSHKPSIRTGYLGIGVGAVPGLHDRNMHFDDTLLPMGPRVMTAFVLRHLG